MFSDEYIKEINAAYWAEDEEFKAVIHQIQVLEQKIQVLKRIKIALAQEHIIYKKITHLNWHDDEKTVQVSLDGNIYGTFDYVEKPV